MSRENSSKNCILIVNPIVYFTIIFVFFTSTKKSVSYRYDTMMKYKCRCLKYILANDTQCAETQYLFKNMCNVMSIA